MTVNCVGKVCSSLKQCHVRGTLEHDGKWYCKQHHAAIKVAILGVLQAANGFYIHTESVYKDHYKEKLLNAVKALREVEGK